jgi:hypothetical protein
MEAESSSETPVFNYQLKGFIYQKTLIYILLSFKTARCVKKLGTSSSVALQPLVGFGIPFYRVSGQ